MTTAFLGLSHLGIVSSAGWASHGAAVVGVDPDTGLVERLQRGDLPVHEPGLAELLASCRPRLTYSADVAAVGACDLVIVSRDVPTNEANVSDLAPVLALIDLALPHLRQDVVMVVMCQVPPGFTRSLGERIGAARPELSFTLYYWVETLIFGRAVERCLKPERFMVGCADPAAPLAPVFGAGLERFACPILRMRYESAELTKTAINLYLIGSVTYANTLADLCELLGADWQEMVPALKLDARIGQAAYLQPSLGIAGGNLERDLITLRGLAQQHQLPSGYLDALLTANEGRLGWIERQLQTRVFARANGRQPTIGMWGLTYKKDTRSTKNSPALRLLPRLTGRAQVRAWDPAVGAGEEGIAAEVMDERDQVLDLADALLIMADWDHFALADLERIRTAMRRPLIIDASGVLQARRAEMHGIQYVGMGQ